MKLKKIEIGLISILFSICFLFSGCINYDGYRRVNLLDEQLGSVMLPENWEVTTENGYMYFLDADSGEVIAEEHFRGRYYHIGNKTIDERRYNEKFENYVRVEGIEGSGNSNGGQYGVFLCMYEGKELVMRRLFFFFLFSSFSLEMYVLQEVSTDVLSKIAKSYEYEKKA